MLRTLSQTLIRPPQALTLTKPLSSLSSSRLFSRRSKSGHPEPPEFIEIDLGPEPETESEPGSGSGSEAEAAIEEGVRRLEDAIHGIIVRRCCPDWLPFVPGSSYWVPPKRRVEFVGRVSAASATLSEENMELMSFRGWPSAAYFLDGALPHPVKRRSSRKLVAQSDDEE